VVKRNGFTLLEVVISLALFGVFLIITAQMTKEMNGYEKRLPINFMSHPQMGTLLSRVRRDVLDSTEYESSYDKYTSSAKTLILVAVQPSGYTEHVVWDFSKPGEAHRRSFSVGNETSDWIARGLPPLAIVDYEIEDHPDSVRVQLRDQKGFLAIDQIFTPRRHGQ
jgi:prepilin-type N-terminal cleavage/methylation domain-containing protein